MGSTKIQFAKISPKTSWKWRKLDRERGTAKILPCRSATLSNNPYKICGQRWDNLIQSRQYYGLSFGKHYLNRLNVGVVCCVMGLTFTLMSHTLMLCFCKQATSCCWVWTIPGVSSEETMPNYVYCLHTLSVYRELMSTGNINMISCPSVLCETVYCS